jgi:CubicO group peptidase (beta-lactamase class C family)
LGILRLHPGADDDLAVVSCGVLSTDTGVPVTDDTLFQLGSLTKIATTTMVMQLVDEGRLDLDQPVIDLLPEFRLADATAAEHVTIRHLVAHTSGMPGDVFIDTGRGDDCLARYVAALADEPMAHPLGAMWSYCNAGFVVAGRVLSRLTGMTWEAAIADRLFGPLGLTHAVTLPEDALLFRAAVGHIGEAGAPPDPTRTWGLPRPLGPAGLITASAADVLTFVRMHLRGGLAADGARVLSERGVAAMADRQVDLPADAGAVSWGLGWGRYDWGGQLVLGHNGATIGQAAFLRVLPGRGLAVVLLTNGGDAADLYDELFREMFDELAGVSLPANPAPPACLPAVDLAPYLGTFERTAVRFEVFVRDGVPVLRRSTSGVLATLQPEPVREYDLVPVADGRYVIREPGARMWTPVTFLTGPDGRLYLHSGSRATVRRSDDGR